MKINGIPSPLPGEHLAATFPVMRPEAVDAGWRLRLNFWAGRSLTAEALELEQENRGAGLAWRGRTSTQGIVRGLEVALETPEKVAAIPEKLGHFIHIRPGHGFLANGEDVVVPRPLRVPLDSIPVHYVRIGEGNEGTPTEPAPSGAAAGETRDAGGLVYTIDDFDPTYVPWAAVLTVAPAEFRSFSNLDPEDPCELDPSQDAFADERRVDACVFRLCQLPVSWQKVPELSDPTDPRWRNRLAHVLFAAEAAVAARQQLRFRDGEPDGRRWDTRLVPSALLPWDVLGVPIALVSAETATDNKLRFFLDRAVVARPGGRSRSRTRPALRLATTESDVSFNPPGAGHPLHWRARVDQFAEHLGAFTIRDEAEIDAIESRFQYAPPAGFLPRPALNLLTTEQALSLPTHPGQSPDRAGISHFFPASYAVEAVPVPLEDLDAVLAASAALAPYDFGSVHADSVRLLVPLPERVFDPALLVVEQPAPIFEETVARFVGIRQDWRQRRDTVRTRRDVLQETVTGPLPPLLPVLRQRGQLEVEPVETPASIGFAKGLLSPEMSAGPWELRVDLNVARSIAGATAMFFALRLDEEAIPSRIELSVHCGQEEFRFNWTDRPTTAHEPLDAEGQPAATALWFRFVVTGQQLGIESKTVTGFTIHIEDGHVGIAAAGQTQSGPGGSDETVWWTAGDSQPVTFTGGDWTPIAGNTMLAPFEDGFIPVFPDGRTEAVRVAEIEEALNPSGATARAVPLSVATVGLSRVLEELENEASEADDFVDANFTRAQINLYRIRKLVLGETAAQKLLINPAIAVIAEQETATASAEQFGAFLSGAKTRKVSLTAVNDALTMKPSISSVSPLSCVQGGKVDMTITGTNLLTASAVTLGGAGVTAVIQKSTPTSLQIQITVAASAGVGARSLVVRSGDIDSDPFTGFTVTSSSTHINFTAIAKFNFTANLPTDLRTAMVSPVDTKMEALKGVFGQRPEVGPTLPPRGLSVGQRFTEPPATQNLSYARAALTTLLSQLPKLRMVLTGQSVRTLDGQEVSLLDLQGRAKPSQGSQETSESLRKTAINKLLTVKALTVDTDEAEVTLAALDFTETKSAVLRTIERLIQERRALIQSGYETISLLNDQRDLATSRVMAIEGKLDETRQDVSVARALLQEERRRAAAVNERRDSLLRDEVKFLAYVRPRAVDSVRRNVQYWKLEPTGTPAAVPACLRRHDVPPPPLNAYIQLLQHTPVRWFPGLLPLISKLDTAEKLIALLESVRTSALSFGSVDPSFELRTFAQAVQTTVMGAHSTVGAMRQKASAIEVAGRTAARWTELLRDAAEHAAIGDLIGGKHGSTAVSSEAAAELERIGQVATCLHAEFAAVPAVVRLSWIERFSQFDRPVLLRDLAVLPQYGRLDRDTRRRLQQYADWLFTQINPQDSGAMGLINDLIRLCMLLASHAPVNRIISGHVPRPIPIRVGIQIPIRPLDATQVRVGMEFHVWQDSRVIARGRVEDLHAGEVQARVEHVELTTTTLDTSMKIQFVASGLSLLG